MAVPSKNIVAEDPELNQSMLDLMEAERLVDQAVFALAGKVSAERISQAVEAAALINRLTKGVIEDRAEAY